MTLGLTKKELDPAYDGAHAEWKQATVAYAHREIPWSEYMAAYFVFLDAYDSWMEEMKR